MWNRYRRYFLPTFIVSGGKVFYDKTKKPERYGETIYPNFFWKLLLIRIWNYFEFEFRHCGAGLRLGARWRMFFWKPICPFWIDDNGKPVRSKQFQYLTFSLLDNYREEKKPTVKQSFAPSRRVN